MPYAGARNIACLLPWIGLACYAAAIVLDYSVTLDANLVYRRPAIAVAPEDVLGLGFWTTWAVVASLLTLLTSVAYGLGARKIETAFVVAFFVALSATDYYLYGVLAAQVLNWR